VLFNSYAKRLDLEYITKFVAYTCRELRLCLAGQYLIEFAGTKKTMGKNERCIFTFIRPYFRYILLISTFCFFMYSIYYKTAHIYATFFKTILLFGSIFVVLEMCLSLECQFLGVRSLLMLPPDSKNYDRELTSFCFVWHTWNVTDETLNLCLFDRWKSIKCGASLPSSFDPLLSYSPKSRTFMWQKRTRQAKVHYFKRSLWTWRLNNAP